MGNGRSSMGRARHLVMAKQHGQGPPPGFLLAGGQGEKGFISDALSSVGAQPGLEQRALSLFREPASRWAAAGRTLGFDRTEGDVEGAAGGAANMELVQHAAPTLELGAVLVLLAKGSTARPGLRRPRRGDGRRALLVKGSTAYPGREDPPVEMGGEDADHGPGWTMGGDHTTLGGLQPDLLLMTLVGLDFTQVLSSQGEC
ncbi:unnamed protein product [Heterosigma akashiwo]